MIKYHAARQPIRRAVLQRFDVIVDSDGYHARLAGYIAAKHQHHSELAHRMREGQHRPSKNSGERQRNDNPRERPPTRRPQRPCRGDQSVVHAGECRRKRLHPAGQHGRAAGQVVSELLVKIPAPVEEVARALNQAKITSFDPKRWDEMEKAIRNYAATLAV